MSQPLPKFGELSRGAQALLGLALLAVLALMAHYVFISLELRQTRTEYVQATLALEQTTDQLALTKLEKEGVENSLQAEKLKNEDLERKLSKVTGTVDELEKLTQTDPELLKKYSKVYFLNENYEPPTLRDIPEEYLAKTNEKEQILWKVDTYLRSLMRAAEEDGASLKIVSAYRSFEEQTSLKSAYRVTYGSGANAFSADQGYSEHQLGTTVDFSSPSINNALVAGFDKTSEYKWLEENAHRFGFVMSYPEGNAYYEYEPWHWRFVGEDLARDLNRDGKHFYDLDQRTIDSYLISIFD